MGHKFGDIQANIIQPLHEAALQGKPWVHGRTTLAKAVSNALQMCDVFRQQKY
jgi:hypothetical protein